jgi:tRNA pseudouridine32 synthase/23S rRNA pseudouridine746 synthase
MTDIIPLAIKNGVSPNALWLPEGNWDTYFEFFLNKFPHLDKNECTNRFSRSEVVLSCGTVLKVTSQYQSGKHLYFYRELVNELQVPFEENIVFEDENIIIADKPHFLPVAPTGQYLHETLLVRLRKKLKIDELELCHRLDRETAGLVMLSKKKEVRAQYHALFSERKIIKTYHAIAQSLNSTFPFIHKSKMVKGEPYFRMKEVNGEPNSETNIQLLERRGNKCLYQLSPVTGKKHQLRVHLAGLGIPIINDPIYPDIINKTSNDFTKPLQLLAKSIEFVDPFSHKNQVFQSDKLL